MKELGIYVHIPFCKRKCYYCDFYSINPQDESIIERYFKALNKELQEVGENINGAKIKTIYIGGGTPSFVNSKYIVEIFRTMRNNFSISDEAEITIEVNPGTVTKKKLETYINTGINRISIGMQSSDNSCLNTIGRIHSWEDFLETYNLAREVGFKNINIDCMIGLPDQTLANVEDTINKVISLNPEHVSVYSLIIEEGTKIEKLLNTSKISLPDEKIERDMYWKVKRSLEQNGYKQYEISNFARPGLESKHNLDCWKQKEYIGFGAGAHSYTDGCRYSNIADIKEYIKNYEKNQQEDNIEIHEKQDKTAMAKEFILLALRTIDGCNKQAFYEKFGYDIETGFKTEFEKLIKMGLIKIEKESISLTDKGLDLANLVWEEFI